jgi:tetratricopeptide (TPR) repeat protein
MGDFESAYNYYSRHLELTERTGTKGGLCTALLAVGDVLTKLKDFAEAEKYIQRAIEMCRALGFQRLVGVGLLNLGALALEQNQLERALTQFEEGTQTVRAVNTQRQIINGLFFLGYTWLRLGNSPAALAHLQEGLQLARTPRHICDLQRMLVHTYLAVGELDPARQALREALRIVQSLESHPQKMNTLSSAIAYWQRFGQHEQAAIWTGVLIGERHIDQALFKPVCAELEAALGGEAYQRALEQGKTLELDEVISEIASLLAQTQV